MPRNYQNARIYRLVSASGRQYIGSTTELLCRRMVGHRGKYKLWKQGKYPFMSSFRLFDEEGKVEIFLVENYPCESHEELLRRERYWIETTDCVNKIIPTRTYKEYCEANKQQILERKKKHYQTNKDKISEQRKIYRESNKQQISERMKKYYETNREQLLEQNKQKIQCGCGVEFGRKGLSRHRRSKKHLRWVEDQQHPTRVMMP